MPTGVGLGLAIPHARLPGLSAPVAGLALCDSGVDFGGPDGELATIAVLVLTPEGGDLIQLELMAEVAGMPGDPETRRRVATARRFEELSRALRDAPVRAGEH